jgi:5-methylthioadenosine/S-adenosylhomocysteine deaminase
MTKVKSTLGAICVALQLVGSSPARAQDRQALPQTSRLAQQDRTLVLSGSLVSPGKILKKGWLVIKQGRITQISETPPTEPGAIRIDTDDLIFPGFVDLHNHPLYSAFRRWEGHPKFKNRYEWRGSDAYGDALDRPGREIQRNDQSFCDFEEFAEVRAIIGGTTSFSGMFGRRSQTRPIPECLSGLVRKLDLRSGFFSDKEAPERVRNVLGLTPRDLSEATDQEVGKSLAHGDLDLLLIHVAEGVSSDPESSEEFGLLKQRGFLGPKTAIIHGVALGKKEFREMHTAGTALIWSPRSNMDLYGKTADVATAFREGVSIALAPDWAPTGSNNMLEELRYASDVDRTLLEGLFSDRQLFEMATSIPARIASIDDKAGSLEVGLYADLFLVRGDSKAPFRSLLRSRPQDIDLVLVGGVPAYGNRELMGKFKTPLEPLTVCGSSKALNSGLLGGGTFGQIRERISDRFKAYKLSIAPLADCEK